MEQEEWLKYLRKADDTTLNQLLDVLKLAQQTPKFEVNSGLQYGSFSPASNLIKINPYTGNNKETFAHELTHAVDKAMQDHAFEVDTNSKSLFNLFNQYPYKNKEFQNAYFKLTPRDSNLPDVQNNLKNDKRSYRYSNSELRAHGVENTMPGRNNYPLSPVGSHVDPTMATELAILLDLYTRSLRKK